MSALIAAASPARTATATTVTATTIATITLGAAVTVMTVQAARNQGRDRNWFGGWQADHADGGSISRRQFDLDGRRGKDDKRPGGTVMHPQHAATPTARHGAVTPPASARSGVPRAA
ncbi:MAG: hypothetical protein CMO30_12050 [Tistrella sp.]|jgi:hypothetical protein|uniref:Uncharacterized protein n=1 Tax=Tistrella mobilis TaxID=171437 RepID=A0A161PZD1_9PROT|nr:MULTISPECIES: hypothetical protein [Tistrella]KYO57367.1 hypothetical protein AUP44_20445 [Tistrella mobilis]MAD37558.1 hypothetical protein [Tistrella sp.]MBA75998.1 hypothetical protein [Tistrella sp.]HAE46346.1 hypothetical protein [Tistrella mobilis]